MSEEYTNNEINESEINELPVVEEVNKKSKKARAGIPVPMFIMSILAVVVAASMVMGVLMYGFYRDALNTVMSSNTTNIVVDGADVEELADNIDLIKKLYDAYYYYEADEEAQFDAVLKAYVEASGDRYGEYYTKEEFEALWKEAAGDSEGIGINVINSTIMVGGYNYKAFKVINIVKGGPASKSDLKVGDYIFFVEDENGEFLTIDSLGYNPALSMLKGKAGTVVTFKVFRDIGDESYEEITFSIERAAVETSSVMSHVCTTDPDVGIVKITGFDLTTPTQFDDALDEFIEMGIHKIVFDVRYNPGGDLASIVAVLSRLLDNGDIVISAADKQGNRQYITVQPERGYDGIYASCNVSRSDIGKYKDLDVAVLCNGDSASAAELFVANFRDHGIGKVVGTTTYGKGSMQSIVDLSGYGFEGGLRFTTRVYFPPCGESYDGIGIVPDVIVELDEELLKKNIYDISDAEDNQLQAAIDTLK